MKRKQEPKKKVNDDERWSIYDQLKSEGEVIKANKLKQTILDSYKYKKPCHHMTDPSNKD